MICAICLARPEECFEKNPILLKIIISIISDADWKIRIQGAIFFNRYLPQAFNKSPEHPLNE